MTQPSVSGQEGGGRGRDFPGQLHPEGAQEAESLVDCFHSLAGEEGGSGGGDPWLNCRAGLWTWGAPVLPMFLPLPFYSSKVTWEHHSHLVGATEW